MTKLQPIILIFLFTHVLFGQSKKNKQLFVASDTIQIDTLSLISKSIVIKHGDKTLDSTAFFHPLGADYIIITSPNLKQDSIDISYETYSINFNKKYQHKIWDQRLVAASKENNPFSISIPNKQNWYQNDDINLNKRGSISRGVIFGSQRSLAVNSNFNLQLSGKLAPNLNVLASMSDENIPIQPQGNTQQLQDFDRIFIQLYNDDFKLIAGDFDYLSSGSHFLNFRKRLKGISIYTQQKASNLISEIKNGTFDLQAGGAISKGKFARNEIQGIEGNQGPYQLYGEQSETYIMILSGTERIYIDGVLLKRGQEYDYIIDYNTAQLTFTSKQLITKDKRIRAEFQYTDQNYLRSLFHVRAGYKAKKWDIQFNFYNEQDHKNQPINQDLNDAQKLILAGAGDDLIASYFSSVDSIGFDENRVMYRMIDSLGYDSVLVYSQQADAIFFATFAFVGGGNGDYIKSALSPNGRTFQWIAPQVVNGILVHFGDYAPIRALVPSEKKQMINLNGNIQSRERDVISYDFSFSNLDRNTFSKKDTKDNQGFAAWIKADQYFKTNKKDSSNKNAIKISNEIEYTSKHFNPIERFRGVEFNRDWNLNLPALQLNEPLLKGSSAISYIQSKNHISYQFNYIQLEQYKGFKHDFSNHQQWKYFSLKNDWSLLNNQKDSIRQTFLRNKDLIQFQDETLKFGFKDDHEYNISNLTNSNTTLSTSYQYYDWQIYGGTSDSLKNQFEVYYGQRYDNQAKLNDLRPSTFAQNMGALFSANKNRDHQLKALINYRILDVKDSTLTNATAENTLLGRLEHSLKLWKRLISFQTFYEIGSGLERKREFRYIEVAPGAGNFIWNDYNDNGIKELSEFEEDPYSGFANYIRTFVLTEELNTVYTNQFNERILINPAFLLRGKKGFYKFISRFSNQSTYQSKRSSLREATLGRFNPFNNSLADTQIIQKQELIRNTFSFNRNNPKFNVDYNYQYSDRQQVLSDGLEQYRQQFNNIRIRWNFFKSIGVIIEAEKGDKHNTSENTPNKNFSIDYNRIAPSLVYQPNTKIRISLNTSYQEKNNAADLGGEKSYISIIGTEIKYNQIKKGLLQFKLNYIFNKYLGDTQNSVAFEMLESYQPGRNLVMEAGYQRSLGDNLQLNINYTVRLNEDGDLRQVGGVQLRAFF